MPRRAGRGDSKMFKRTGSKTKGINLTNFNMFRGGKRL